MRSRINEISLPLLRDSHNAIVAEPFMVRDPHLSFSAVKLNVDHDNGWAVVGNPSGAIAEDASGKLLLRLSEDEAKRNASFMTAVAASDVDRD